MAPSKTIVTYIIPLIVEIKDDLTIQKDAPKTGCSGLTGVITSRVIKRYHNEINFELPLIDSKESTWTSAKLACERWDLSSQNF